MNKLTTRSAAKSAEQAEGEQTPRKKSYAKPALAVFGSVRDLTQSGSGIGTDRRGRRRRTSDRRAKENIVRIGTHPLGIGIYLFDYKPEFRARCGDERQCGVMADEVELVMPEAVAMQSNGYKAVDYGRLGIDA